MDTITPSDVEIRETIVNMGADDVKIVRESGVMYVAFYRRSGCGRIYVNVCSYLAKRFQEMEIVVLESPRLNRWCQKARVRKPGAKHFSRTPVLATASRLGIV